MVAWNGREIQNKLIKFWIGSSETLGLGEIDLNSCKVVVQRESTAAILHHNGCANGCCVRGSGSCECRSLRRRACKAGLPL